VETLAAGVVPIKLAQAAEKALLAASRHPARRLIKTRTHMAEVKFRKSRGNAWAAFGMVGLLTVPLGLLALWDIAAWGTRWQVGDYDSFGTAVFLLALEAGLGGLLTWLIANEFSARFTDEGVAQRGLGGWKFIPWGEVTHVRVVDYALHLHKGRKKVIIPKLAYADWEEVVDFILGRLPPGPPERGGR